MTVKVSTKADNDLTTVIGQLSISEGVWRRDTPNQVAVREPKAADAPGAGKGDLFIVTEIQGNVKDRDVLEQKLAHTIRDSYYLARGSVTAGLRRAIQAGNELLYRRNSQVQVEDRVVGGAAVLVSSGEDAFVGQIGPAAFFAVLGDHVRRYPSRSIWLDEAVGNGEEDASSLGLRKVVEPALHHLRVAEEDVLVVADSRLAGHLPIRDLVYAVDTEDVRAAVKRLGEVARGSHGSGIVLKVIGVKSTGVGPIKVSAEPTNWPSLWQRQPKEPKPVPSSPPEAEEVLAEAPESTGKLSNVFANTSVMQKPLQWWESFRGRIGSDEENEELLHREPRRPVDMPAPHRPPGPKAVISTRPRPELVDPEVDDQVDKFDHDPIAQEMAMYQDEAEPATDGTFLSKLWRALVTALLTIVMVVGRGAKTVLGWIIPASQQRRQAGMQAEESGPPISWRTLGIIAAIIPIIVVLVVGVTYLQQGQQREAEYQEFITTAQSKIEQAGQVDAASALALMSEAENALVQAEQVKPEGQPEITEIRQQIAIAVDQVGNVQRFNLISPVRQYTDPGTELGRIVAQGVEIYVLDEGNDRIYHHRLAGDGNALLPDDPSNLLITARGQTVGNAQVAELFDMVWMSTGGNRQTSDLVVLNSTSLLEYNTNWGITTAPLAVGDTLQRPVAVDSYFGNFYVLDPQANTLLRFVPTVDGYTAPPQSYFVTDEPVDLSNAVDLGIDGAIYVLYSSGRIDKYLSGQITDFNLTGLDQPLNNPVSIFTRPDEEVQHLYVADAGNQRIVQLNKDGSFVRQFKPPAGAATSFAGLQDVYVDEIGGRMYVLDSNKLYLANLPE